MMSAESAREVTRQVIEKNHAELKERLSQAIESAINQGSMKTNFYPRNNLERDAAMTLLQSLDYSASVITARDQRDRDVIHIGWEA